MATIAPPQPVQTDGRMACIRLTAPTIASTGHAAIHSVQPMHAASSIRATLNGVVAPHAGSSGSRGRPVS